MLSTDKQILLLSLVLVLIVGCSNRQTFTRNQLAPKQKAEITQKYPSALQQYYIALAEEGDRNAVLNYMKIGKKAYTLNYLDNAEEAFDKATFGIEQIYGYDQKAADVRSLWIEEGAKSFKGEPYERAMAFFYRGLLYLEAEDYDNARASFKSGQLQDAFAEEEQNRCDFALLMFMEGWCSAISGDFTLAEKSFKETKSHRQEFVPPEDHNTLILVESGTSPRKVADGPGHSELKFRRGRGFEEQTVQVSVNGQKAEKMLPLESIYWQAVSRGGRAVDKIVGGKAKFRSSTAQVGNVTADIGSTAVLVSPLFDSAGNAAAIGGAIGLVGVTSMAIAQNSRPHADTRYWDSLPDTIHVFTAKLEPDAYNLKFEFLDKDGKILPDKTVEKTVTKHAEKGLFVWIPSPSL
jgi:tetratricopeptide (TPR) repeat protein